MTTTDVKTVEKESAAAEPATGEVTRMEELRLRPLADVYRDEHAVRILMDVPGARDDQIDVQVHDGVLSVEAKAERGDRELRVYERSFRLDRRMNTADIAAGLDKGVLTLTIPFLEEARPRRIEVKSA